MDSFSLDAVRIESIFFFSLGLGLLVGMKVGFCVGMSFKAFSNFNAPGLKKPEMPLLNVTAINSGLCWHGPVTFPKILSLLWRLW